MTKPEEAPKPLPEAGPLPPAAPEKGLARARPKASSRDPLHGLTLEALLVELQACYGWEALAQQVPIRCFSSEPSIASSLKFLRKTPWAREKVEGLYLFMKREQARQARGPRGG